MKKALLLVLAVLLIASVAIAGITGSKHDLGTGGGAAPEGSVDEICVYCHTPHGSNTAMTAAPLWNRSGGTAVTAWASNYTSSTLNGTSNTNGAISRACLSCHDGNVGDEVLVNAPGSGTSGTLTWPGGSIFSGIANLNDGQGLKNDHPIGVNVNTVNADDPGIYNSTDIAPTYSTVTLYSGNTTVECASCHKVHDNTIPPKSDRSHVVL